MSQPEPVRAPRAQDAVEQRVRPFADVLQQVDQGRAHALISDLLRQLVAAVRDTGRKGKLNIAVTVAQLSDGKTLSVNVVPKLDAPNDWERAGVFFVDRNANLTREDPDAPMAGTPLRSVGGNA